MEKSAPNYKRIYTDILHRKYPDKFPDCEKILEKQKLNTLDIIRLNQLIFGNSDKQAHEFNQKHRSYDRKDILAMLDYQKKNKLNDAQLAVHFNLSRNSVAKWKKLFLV